MQQVLVVMGRPHHKHKLVRVGPVKLHQDQDPGNRNPLLERAAARRKERAANGDTMLRSKTWNMQIEETITFISLFIKTLNIMPLISFVTIFTLQDDNS